MIRYLILAILLKSLSVYASTLVLTAPESAENLACQSGVCGQYSYAEIRSMFRGLLLTLREIREIERLANSYKDTVFNTTVDLYTFSDDGAMCCSSRFHHIANNTLTNIWGETKSVIHLTDVEPPVYQYIPHASCVKKGDCKGRCVLEGKIMSVLVLDPTTILTFDVFEIPGYCTCKNIT